MVAADMQLKGKKLWLKNCAHKQEETELALKTFCLEQDLIETKPNIQIKQNRVCDLYQTIQSNCAAPPVVNKM